MTAGGRLTLLCATVTAALLAALPGTTVAPAAADQGEARSWRPDVSAALSYANGRAGRVSFTVVDMTGRFHRHHGHHKVPMASTFKVMLMVAYLRLESVDHRDLTRAEKRLIRPMIRRSDNTAATRIRDRLGRGPIEALARRARMKSFRWHSIWGLCRTSSRDQAYFMRTLRRYVPDRHWPFAKRQLASIVPGQRWGIAQVKPRGWKLHFKGGWGSGTGAVDHQVALLRRDHRRVGVAVMTESSPSHAYAAHTLEGVFRRLLRELPR